MKFLNFNYANGNCVVICLDDITFFQNDGDHNTLIFIRNMLDEPFGFGRDIDYVLGRVFSDVAGGEYQLVDIDEVDEDDQGPEPVWMPGADL